MQLQNKLIPLYLPPHASHLLQPLDVACFGPLKELYGQQIEDFMRNGINHVDKTDFLQTYKRIQPQFFSLGNIDSAFFASGLASYKPTRVLRLVDLLNTNTPR